MKIHLNALQTAALRSNMIAAEAAVAAGAGAQAIVHAYIAAILQGRDLASNTPIADIDLRGAEGTITLEIKDAETEGRTEEDCKLD